MVHRKNWIYICAISAVALLLAVPAITSDVIDASQWKAFFILIALSMAAQVVSSAMPRQRLRIPRMIFFFTGVLLLEPLLILSLILLITILDWEHDRREGNPSVRDGFLLPLSLGTNISAAFCSHWILVLFQTVPLWILSVWSVFVVVLAALAYATVHHVIKQGQTLIQGLDWDESGLFDIDTLFVKMATLFIGYGLAILWVVNPWLLLIGLIPGLYYYQIHVIPALKIEAYTDAKTGLSNMRHFDELFHTELSRASRMNMPLSVIMVDVDDLGIINNTYGHLTGDSALLTVSEAIRWHIAKTDIAARLGGEEFAIVLTETDTHKAVAFAESLRQQISSTSFDIVNQDQQLTTTVSIGIATFPQHGITTLELIHSADIAMYQAKMYGKNQVILADEVKELIQSGSGSKESTEILNYRAAYSMSKDEIHVEEGSQTITSRNGTVIKDSAVTVHEHLTTIETISQSHVVQISSGRSGADKSHNRLNNYNNRLLTANDVGNLSIVADSRQVDSEPAHRVVALDPQPEGRHRISEPIVDNNRHSKTSEFRNNDKLLENQPTTAAQRASFGGTPLEMGIDSAVTKYQSELLNGPPTTEIINGLRRQQEPIELDDTKERIPPLFGVTTIVSAIAVGAMFLTFGPLRIDLLSLVVFGIVALIVQLLQQSMYESSTVSVSAAIILAGTLVEGMPGLLTTSAIVVMVHSLQNHTSFYKAAFSWSAHVIAGLAPLAIHLLGMPYLSGSLTLLILLTLVSAIIYYAIESIFIASAIGLAKKQNIFEIWDTHFRWQIIHYMVAGFIALSMALAFIALGPWGVVAFAMPVLLIYFAQKQYVVRTENSTRKLNHMNHELSKANNTISTANRSFQRLTDELFMILSKIIDARDPDVHGHAAQVANYAEAIAHELGIKQDEIERVRHGALLHDIGKIGISELILHKPGPLTDNEYETIKSHPELGADFLETCQSLRSLAPYVRHHHEWWNGKGYPARLYQDEIPMGARIIAVCDAVEAMTSDRPYRKGLSRSQVISELEKGKGIQFDPLVIDAFIKIIKREDDSYLRNTAHRSTLEPQATPISL